MLNITLGPGGDMMIGVMVAQIDLNASPRLFDVKMVQEHYTANHTLIPCSHVKFVNCMLDLVFFKDAQLPVSIFA